MTRRSLTEDDPRHGTVNGYNNLKCRCSHCRKAWTLYMQEQYRKHPIWKARRNRKERMISRAWLLHPQFIRARRFVDPAYFLPWPEFSHIRAGGLWRLIMEVAYGARGRDKRSYLATRKNSVKMGDV